MLFAILTGILMSITLLIVMARIGIRKFMGYPAILDIAIVVALAMLLHGTLGGITAAISGGLFLSLVITIIRIVYGYERLTFRGWVVVSYGMTEIDPKVIVFKLRWVIGAIVLILMLI